MFLELIATLVAGIAAAGIVLLLNKVLGGRLPRWFVPLAAGAAMILATVTSEYGWYARTKASLPEGFTIAETVESRALYRPWTYVAPFVERFVAVDTATLRSHAGQPGARLADVYLFGRWSPVSRLPVLADCPGQRRAALADGIGFAEDGSVSGADWLSVPADDALLATICGAD